MAVTIKVHGHIAEFFPGKRTVHTMDIAQPKQIRAAVTELGVNPELILMAIVNGQRQSMAYELKDGDEVVLISPTAGG